LVSSTARTSSRPGGELRGAFRHFRLERIGDARRLDDRPPKSRRNLLAAWKAEHLEIAL
jgi:predicted DNA-binding transcriptional regulator YafY